MPLVETCCDLLKAEAFSAQNRLQPSSSLGLSCWDLFQLASGFQTGYVASAGERPRDQSSENLSATVARNVAFILANDFFTASIWVFEMKKELRLNR